MSVPCLKAFYNSSWHTELDLGVWHVSESFAMWHHLTKSHPTASDSPPCPVLSLSHQEDKFTYPRFCPSHVFYTFYLDSPPGSLPLVPKQIPTHILQNNYIFVFPAQFRISEISLICHIWFGCSLTQFCNTKWFPIIKLHLLSKRSMLCAIL